MNVKFRRFAVILALLLSLCLSLGACIEGDVSKDTTAQTAQQQNTILSPNGFDLASIPAFADQPYVVLNQNTPYFEENEIIDEAYESYGDLDSLGRCTQAIACLGTELMPTEERGSISSVKPTGWHSVTYDCVSGGDLYRTM